MNAPMDHSERRSPGVRLRRKRVREDSALTSLSTTICAMPTVNREWCLVASDLQQEFPFAGIMGTS
jgi:hypothetical protein